MPSGFLGDPDFFAMEPGAFLVVVGLVFFAFAIQHPPSSTFMQALISDLHLKSRSAVAVLRVPIVGSLVIHGGSAP